MAKRGTVAIHRADNERVEIPALIMGDWAVHRAVYHVNDDGSIEYHTAQGGLWNVTHVPTGYAVWGIAFMSRNATEQRYARAVAEKLVALGPMPTYEAAQERMNDIARIAMG